MRHIAPCGHTCCADDTARGAASRLLARERHEWREARVAVSEWLILPGTLLVLLALEDIFYTVLFQGSNDGLVGIAIMRGGWWIMTHVAAIAGQTHRRVLTYSGPIILVAHVSAWVFLFAFGFAFIDWPALGSAIQNSQGSTSHSFATALYFSAYAFTTLGTGDIVATTGPYRLVMVIEAAIGFATLTSGFTYLLTITSAIVRRNTFASTLYTVMGRSEDAAELIVRLGAGGQFNGASTTLTSIVSGMLDVLEAQRGYPMLRYFYYLRTFETLPHLLLAPMDTAALIRTTLHPDHYRGLIESAAVAGLWEGGQHELDTLRSSFLPAYSRESFAASPDDERVWRERYYKVLKRLRETGIETIPDPETGADRYVEMRRDIHPRILALTTYMRYPPMDEGVANA